MWRGSGSDVFPRPFRTDLVSRAYQTLRVWLISTVASRRRQIVKVWNVDIAPGRLRQADCVKATGGNLNWVDGMPEE